MPIDTDTDVAHLSRAITLAEHGRGMVSPNPMVGAVIVRDGKVLGEGFHSAYGEAHASRAALAA
jgi:diaminohydroxyphosphoribosylaminopyrimidine deaminase / 5-amino-6-(5-phosphoribosylamino)uracil reductase